MGIPRIGALCDDTFRCWLYFCSTAFLFTAWAADIPIREVILYKSGVGYFERGGTLLPGESGAPGFQGFRHERCTEVADHLRPERR